MSDKDREEIEDTDYTDEQGGGGAEQEEEFTEDEFDAALYKATRRVDQRDEGGD